MSWGGASGEGEAGFLLSWEPDMGFNPKTRIMTRAEGTLNDSATPTPQDNCLNVIFYLNSKWWPNMIPAAKILTAFTSLCNLSRFYNWWALHWTTETRKENNPQISKAEQRAYKWNFTRWIYLFFFKIQAHIYTHSCMHRFAYTVRFLKQLKYLIKLSKLIQTYPIFKAVLPLKRLMLIPWADPLGIPLWDAPSETAVTFIRRSSQEANLDPGACEDKDGFRARK